VLAWECRRGTNGWSLHVVMGNAVALCLRSALPSVRWTLATYKATTTAATASDGNHVGDSRHWWGRAGTWGVASVWRYVGAMVALRPQRRYTAWAATALRSLGP